MDFFHFSVCLGEYSLGHLTLGGHTALYTQWPLLCVHPARILVWFLLLEPYTSQEFCDFTLLPSFHIVELSFAAPLPLLKLQLEPPTKSLWAPFSIGISFTLAISSLYKTLTLSPVNMEFKALPAALTSEKANSQLLFGHLCLGGPKSLTIYIFPIALSTSPQLVLSHLQELFYFFSNHPSLEPPSFTLSILSPAP